LRAAAPRRVALLRPRGSIVLLEAIHAAGVPPSFSPGEKSEKSEIKKNPKNREAES
jgi:hypothetical protein